MLFHRFWLNKIKDQLRQTLAEESDANLKQQLVELEDQYTKDILPDSMLEQVMDRSIFTEITQAFSQSRWQQSDYRVRAWLGLSTDRHSLQVTTFPNVLHLVCTPCVLSQPSTRLHTANEKKEEKM